MRIRFASGILRYLVADLIDPRAWASRSITDTDRLFRGRLLVG
jgi:hypothetical protein